MAASNRGSPALKRAVARRAISWLRGWLGPLIACCLLAAVTKADTVAAGPSDDFSPLVELAPFEVKGEPLSVSIHARSRADRRYAQGFAEEVLSVIYESVTESTGKGLVIIGRKDDPHPIVVFRKFQALAKTGKLDPAVAAREAELLPMLNLERRKHTEEGEAAHDQERREMEKKFEQIVIAMPLPLKGLGANLYQLAWEEKFDEAKVEARLCALRPGDLERRDLFAPFDWVFYLPSKGAFDRVMNSFIADELKKQKVGFFMRTTVKGVLLVMKPKIRKGIEVMRQGMMFMTVAQARAGFTEAEVSALTDAYMEALLPQGVGAMRERIRQNAEKAKNLPAAPVTDVTAVTEAKVPALTDADAETLPPKENPKDGSAHERAVSAVREQIRLNAEKAKKSPAAPVADAAAGPAD